MFPEETRTRADDETRTRDPHLGKVMRYQLRYIRILSSRSLGATDKTLADLRHRFHILKNKVNAEAKDWASLSYLQALVEGHIKQIKDKLISR